MLNSYLLDEYNNVHIDFKKDIYNNRNKQASQWDKSETTTEKEGEKPGI